MIAIKFVALYVVLAWAPQQEKSKETDLAEATAQSIQGDATFADGEPLANLELEFRLRPIGEEPEDSVRLPKIEYLRCETNSEGSFDLKLPNDLEYSGDVIATKWIDHDRRCWHSKIQKLNSNTRNPLELVFENRGRIFLGFLGTSNLPPDIEPLVAVSSADGVRLNRKLDADSRGRMVLNGLEPAEYQIEVYANELSASGWKQSVTVPSASPFRAVATFQFPEFKFGSFKARVLLPDGETPAANARFIATNVDENSRGYGRKELVANNEGLVTGRMGVGEVHLKYDPTNAVPRGIIVGDDIAGLKADLRMLKNNGHSGIAPTSFRAHVRADELTDMGTLRLQKEEEVFAWVEGVIKYADGMAEENLISGGELLSLSEGLPMIGSEGSFRPIAKLEAGAFSARLNAGNRVLAIGIEGTGKPLGAAGGFLVAGERRDKKHVLLPLELAAGEKIRREVVLPLRGSDRSIKLNFEEEQSWAVLLIEIAPGVVWRCEGQFEIGCKHFENVPAGEGLVIVRTNSGDYFAYRKIPAETEYEEISFSKRDVGKLQVAINQIEGQQTENLVIQLSMDSPLGPFASFRAGVKSPILKREGDGSFAFEGIAPGKYRVAVGDGKLHQEQNCEIERGRTTTLQVALQSTASR